jgi:hypothetical protein
MGCGRRRRGGAAWDLSGLAGCFSSGSRRRDSGERVRLDLGINMGFGEGVHDNYFDCIVHGQGFCIRSRFGFLSHLPSFSYTNIC